MKNDTYLYTDDLDAARREGDIALWRASHQANIACKKAIEESIRQGFDGMHLNHDAARGVIQTYGMDRVMLVLANQTRREMGLDDPQVYDTEMAVTVAVEALRELILKDKNVKS